MIFWKNFIDDDIVRGIAIVFRGYKAEIHSHKEEEKYDLLKGEGILHLDGEEIIIKAPYKVLIPGGVRHAMLPISSYVILEYSFDTGPFDNIHYEWHGEKIELKKSSCDLRARL